jgi:hypothetical protein
VKSSHVRARRNVARGSLLVGCLLLAVTACTSENPPSFPEQVLSPAPQPSGAIARCPFGLPRASSIAAGSLAEIMDGHIPHWLPEGMGLVSAYGLSHGAHGAGYFADAQCREMELWFWESERIGSGERIGPWVVTEMSGPRDCFNAVLGHARCINYAGRVEGGHIGVQMLGIPRSEGDRIVRSIPI